MSGWVTGKKRPSKPLDIDLDGFVYRGWVSDIFKSYMSRAGAEGRRLEQGWEDRIWIKLQDKYPHYIQKKPDEVKTMTVSISTILSFVQFVRKRGFDRSVVSTQVATERAEICSRCPLAAITVGCSKCKELVRQVIGTPKMELDFGKRYGKKVEGCDACGCYLPIKAWIPLGFLEEEKDVYPYWENCWIRKPVKSE